MSARRRLLSFLAVLLATGAALCLGLAQDWGWSTPFALPAVISYRGHDYHIDTNTSNGTPGCFVLSRAMAAPRRHIYRLPVGYAPFRQAAAVFGFLTDSNPILLPHYEWHYHLVYVLLVRDGSCLRSYELPPAFFRP